MDNTLLFAPVTIKSGVGGKIDLSSLSEMRDFLEGWEPSRR